MNDVILKIQNIQNETVDFNETRERVKELENKYKSLTRETKEKFNV
ncbi:hypothetical protein ECARS42123_5030, partial [Escherichia coli ARS4.2123]